MAVFLPTSCNSFVLKNLCFERALSTNFVCTFTLKFLFVFCRMDGFNKIRIYALSPCLQEACAIVGLKFKGKSTIFQQDDIKMFALMLYYMYLARSAVLFISR